MEDESEYELACDCENHDQEEEFFDDTEDPLPLGYFAGYLLGRYLSFIATDTASLLDAISKSFVQRGFVRNRKNAAATLESTVAFLEKD